MRPVNILDKNTNRPSPKGIWSRVPLARIEDLQDAVLGSGLEPVQMTNSPVTGSLAFAQYRGMTFTSGHLNGDVALSGPLSDKLITVGVAYDVAPGSWHWMKPVEAGNVGVWHPGDEHDARYRPGSAYAAITLSPEQIETEAERYGMILCQESLGGTGISSRRMNIKHMTQIRAGFSKLHKGDAVGDDLCELALRHIISHCGRKPQPTAGCKPDQSYVAIVAKARDYIDANMQEQIRIGDLVQAAVTSERTLYRAFMEFLGESPQNYVRRLRLHRIRKDLASDREARCSVALIANQWCIDQSGRLSAWYRELFGELPSQTHKRRLQVSP